jgi:hypothetical protein
MKQGVHDVVASTQLIPHPPGPHREMVSACKTDSKMHSYSSTDLQAQPVNRPTTSTSHASGIIREFFISILTIGEVSA